MPHRRRAHSRRPASPEERVVRVLPTLAGPDKAFDYLVPEELGDQVRVGARVRIALGGRRLPGWVVQDWVRPPPGVALRPLAGARGWGPPPAVVSLACWAAWRWTGRAAHFLATASPEVVVRLLPAPPPGRGRRGGPGGGGEVAQLARSALDGGEARMVLCLPPAADRWPVVEAAVAHGLGGAGSPAPGGQAAPGVLVLCPSVELAAQVARRLRRRLEAVPVALLPGDWAVAAAGGCVAVGARAAAWAPLPVLGAAVVLDAHDQSYQSQAAPTWAATEVVAERARREQAPCLLVSPCPPLELSVPSRVLRVSRRAERAGWAVMEVVDMRREDPRAGLFSGKAVQLARRAGPDHQVVCVLNRRGRARLLACSACRELVRCEACGAPLAQSGRARLPGEGLLVRQVAAMHPPGGPGRQPSGSELGSALVCGRCGLERPTVCAACGATRLRALRVGVTRAAEEMGALLGHPVAEVTGSTEAGQGLGQPVVMGTEAVLHRARAPRMGGVVFLDFDQELLATRYQAGEDALALLARAARLVGGRGEGRVVVQTRLPGHEVLAAAVRADPGLLAAAEMELRRALRLPPVAALAAVSGAAAEDFVGALPTAPSLEVMGPAQGRYLVRAPDHQVLCDALAATVRPPGRLRVEVDPRQV